MPVPFLSEIRLMSFAEPPKGWAVCDGQLVSIAQNKQLFALLGTTFGGDGRNDFALPDLRGRVPVHVGGGLAAGASGGEQAHTLSSGELPTHTHPAYATTTAPGTTLPAGALLGPFGNGYGPPPASTPLAPGTVANVGGGQPHNNMQPYLTLMFCIALQGIYPSPS